MNKKWKEIIIKIVKWIIRYKEPNLKYMIQHEEVKVELFRVEKTLYTWDAHNNVKNILASEIGKCAVKLGSYKVSRNHKSNPAEEDTYDVKFAIFMAKPTTHIENNYLKLDNNDNTKR